MLFKSILPVAGIVAALAASPVTAHAQLNITVTNHTKGMSGAARVVNMAGNYQVAQNSRLVRVWIQSLDSMGRPVSGANGRYDANRRTWSVGVGDFRLAYYYVEFTVSTPSGNRVYSTGRYRW